MKIKSKSNRCLVCDHSPLLEIINFGEMALAGSFIKKEQIVNEKKYPMRLGYCENCFTLQISDVINKKEIFDDSYFYFSSSIGTLKKHFHEYARDIFDLFVNDPLKSSILEIGCNDGVLLRPLANLGVRNLIGVDPAGNVLKSIKNLNAHLINDFFSEKVSNEIVNSHGKIDIICANNVYAHLSDFKEITKAIKNTLHYDGVFVFEVHYIDKILLENQYDMIYHEHLFYHSLLSLSEHFKNYDLKIFDIKQINVHGGSMRYYVSNLNNKNFKPSEKLNKMISYEIDQKFNTIKPYKVFSKEVMNHKSKFMKLIFSFKNKGKSIIGYGASGRANTLIQFCNFNYKIIDFIIDDAPQKSGYLTPGTHIPIFSRELAAKHGAPDCIIIFAWSFINEILPKLESIISKETKIIIPFPEIKIFHLEESKLIEEKF